MQSVSNFHQYQNYKYISSLILSKNRLHRSSYFSISGKFDSALKWLQQMEQERIITDLITYGTLIELARKLKEYSKAISLFSKLKVVNLYPDMILYKAMINEFGNAKWFQEAKDILIEIREQNITLDTDLS